MRFAADRTATHLMAMRTAALAIAVVLVTAACIVDTPGIESSLETQPGIVDPSVEDAPATAVPQFEPTAVPAPPTPVVQPTATPTAPPAPTTEPTSVPGPAVTPLPVTGLDGDFTPTQVLPGPVAVPVAGSQFMLDQARPILQLPGHTLIYLDSLQLAEVDVFTPFASDTGTEIGTFSRVVNYIRTDPTFADLVELESTSVAGFETAVFEGTTEYDPLDPVRAFITDANELKDPLLGWYLPLRVQMWVIDGPNGPIIVTAESLDSEGEFDQAFTLANEILDSIQFG